MKKLLNIKLIMDIIKNCRYHRIGRCNICGKYTIFLCRDIKMAREYMICLFCRSSSRKRHVASIILSKQTTSLKTIKKMAKYSHLAIYNTDSHDSFYKYFNRNKYYISSIYSDKYPLGTTIENNVSCQNLEMLTFSDESFDIVITEDVFEHIRDFKKAFSEIYRVLRGGGGYHIFTIPFNFDKNTIIRVDTTSDNDIYLMPQEYHGDSLRGKILAYRTFGIDLFSLLADIGFDTTVHFSGLIDSMYGVYNSFVFISRKL
jgi:SAM-dependent methyltransferase